jgi:hypothetical protein
VEQTHSSSESANCKSVVVAAQRPAASWAAPRQVVSRPWSVVRVEDERIEKGKQEVIGIGSLEMLGMS